LQPFVEMGLDSIIGVEWIHALNRRYGTSIEAIQVYDYPNVEKLTELLSKSIDALSPPHARCESDVLPGEPMTAATAATAANDTNDTNDTNNANNANNANKCGVVAAEAAFAAPPAAPAAACAAAAIAAPIAPIAPAPLAAPAAKPATLLDELVASLAQALFRPADTIDAERGFEAAGLDPIVADEWL
ncbi:acyl carrier protein, partial [Burkholderia pseudomallei]|uniref:acyl carrier protein n=2 Tax=Burkholderiaceae TaxID=119060 RepID=UPI0018A9CF7B